MAKPRIKQGKKQPDPKKAAKVSKAEQAAEHEKTRAIIARAAKQAGSRGLPQEKTNKPRIKKPEAALPKPTVFYDNHRRVFLLVEEHNGFNRYLTCRDEELQVVKLEHGVAPRNSDGLLPEATTHTGDLIVIEGYDLKKAAQKLFSSFLARTPEATRAMCTILGKPVPDLPPELKAARKAAGERLKALRPQLPKPGDEVVAVITPAAVLAEAPSARAGKVLALLAKNKKGMSVGELSKEIGKPVGATVAKLAEAKWVKVKG